MGSGPNLSKNVLTVGAIKDQINDPITSFEIASFSGYGPTDDGRIKPDIVGNGIGLYSPVAYTNWGIASNAYYAYYSGTSMASPNVCGTAAILTQYYKNLYNLDTNNVTPMKSSTLKALLCLTANNGELDHGKPTYRYGYGLVDGKAGAQFLEKSVQTNPTTFIFDSDEDYLHTNDQLCKHYTIQTNDDETKLRVMLAWNDYTDNNTPIYIGHDSNISPIENKLRLYSIHNFMKYYPYSLNKNSPSSDATNRNFNTIDNVQLLEMDVEENSTVTLLVDIDENITNQIKGTTQDFSLLVEKINTSNSSSSSNLLPDDNKADDNTENNNFYKYFTVSSGWNLINFNNRGLLRTKQGNDNSIVNIKYYNDANELVELPKLKPQTITNNSPSNENYIEYISNKNLYWINVSNNIDLELRIT